MREHDGLLGRLEESLSRVSAWIAARRRGERGEAHDEAGRMERLRREVARARDAIRAAGRADLERVRASLDELRGDYDVAAPRTALTQAELQAFRRHLHTTARLLRDLSNLDSPNWYAANEEYERSWAEVERAYSGGGGEPASP